jgi:hypothetical protein
LPFSYHIKEKMKIPGIVAILLVSIFGVHFQEGNVKVTTMEAENAMTAKCVTTAENVHTRTTPTPRLGLQVLVYKFTSFEAGLAIEVNITEILDSDSQTLMSMSAAPTEESPFAVEVSEGRKTVKLLAAQSCEGAVSGALLDVEEIVIIQKPSKPI